MNFVLIFVISFVSIGVLTNFVEPVNAQSDVIPDWIKNNAGWWADGLIDDKTFVDGIEYLIAKGVIPAELETSDSYITQTTGVKKIPSTVKDIFGSWSKGGSSTSEVINQIQFLIKENIISSSKISEIKQKQADQSSVVTRGDNTNYSQGDYSQSYSQSTYAPLSISQNQQTINPTALKESVFDPTPRTKKSITLLVYMVGSDLENPTKYPFEFNASNDIKEMKAGIPGDKINVVLATGGSLGAKKIDGKREIDFRTISLQQVVGTKVIPLGNNLKPQTKMASTDVLIDFINTSTELFPADKYILIMWNHGFGYDGYGRDTTILYGDKKDKQLSLTQLQTALSSTKLIQNGEKFELLGFDACLMATYEVAEKLDVYANYLVASQEKEPGPGWDYKSIVQSLNNYSPQNTESLGKIIGDTIVTSYLKSLGQVSWGTLSVIDLTNFASLRTSFLDFEDYIVNLTIPDQIPKLQTALNKSERYGATDGGDANHLDLKHFVTLFGAEFNDIKNKNGDTWTNAKTTTLLQKINDVVYKTDFGKSKKHANGMSLFFPRTQAITVTDEGSFLGTKGLTDGAIYHNTEKNNLVDFYLDYLKSDIIPPTFAVEQDNIRKNIITGTYGGDDVYEINFYFTSPADDDGWLEIFHTDEYDADERGFEDGEINFPWDGYEPALCNDEFCYPISPEWEWGDIDIAYLPVVVYFKEYPQDGIFGNIIYDITEDEGEFFIGFSPAGEYVGDVTKELLDLSDGDIVQIRTVEVTPDFKQTKHTLVEKLKVDSGFGFSWEVFDWGELDVFVQVCDYGGNCAERQGPFTMDSHDMDIPGAYRWGDVDDPLNAFEGPTETYDTISNTNPDLENIEFITIDEFCKKLHTEFDDEIGWEESQYICDDEANYGSEIDTYTVDIIFDDIWYDIENGWYDDSISVNTFCSDIHDEFDPYLKWQEIQKICTDAQTTYGDSIPIDTADTYWDELVDSASSTNGCPAEYSYPHSDETCEDYPEYTSNTDACHVDYPYLHSDGSCEDYPEDTP